MSKYYALDFSPDDQAERDALVAGMQKYVDACVASEGDFLRYISTDYTVRDLDKVRAALGDDRLTFLGYSYGTYIGAKYADAFPDRVRALVLDGAVDPSLDGKQMQVEQSAGFEGVLDGFLKWCNRDASCAFHRDGKVIPAFDALRARVDAEGLRVPGIPARPHALGDRVRSRPRGDPLRGRRRLLRTSGMRSTTPTAATARPWPTSPTPTPSAAPTAPTAGSRTRSSRSRASTVRRWARSSDVAEHRGRGREGGAPHRSGRS